MLDHNCRESIRLSVLVLSNPRNKFVGMQTDGEGIIGEVRKLCADNPSMLLINATAAIYARMGTPPK